MNVVYPFLFLLQVRPTVIPMAVITARGWNVPVTMVTLVNTVRHVRSIAYLHIQYMYSGILYSLILFLDPFPHIDMFGCDYCLNGGTCMNETCYCRENITGERCEMEICMFVHYSNVLQEDICFYNLYIFCFPNVR